MNPNPVPAYTSPQPQMTYAQDPNQQAMAPGYDMSAYQQQLQMQQSQAYAMPVQQVQYVQPNTGYMPYQQTVNMTPQDATNSLYIENIPMDAQEREIEHIFRQYPGFIVLRLSTKVRPDGSESHLCFADYDGPYNANISKELLSGYKFTKHDKRGLNIKFASTRPNPRPKFEKSDRGGFGGQSRRGGFGGGGGMREDSNR